MTATVARPNNHDHHDKDKNQAGKCGDVWVLEAE
jgi:hypothetical protein